MGKPSGSGENLFRNIKYRVGKFRFNRPEKSLMQGVEFHLAEITADMKGILPTRLSNLLANNGDEELALTPEFDPKEHYYIIHVANNVTAVTLTAEVDGGTATGDGSKTGLSVGPNPFTITTSSNMRPDGYYKIIIERASA